MRWCLLAVLIGLISGAFQGNLPAEEKTRSECTEAKVEKESAFEIPAWAYHRGNVAVYTSQYGSLDRPAVCNGGAQPNQVEYDIPFPVPGKWTLTVFRAMNAVRPVDVYLDGKKIGQICREKTTDSWHSQSAVWGTPLEFTLDEAGKHTMKLLAGGNPFPHFVRLKFESEAAFPEGFELKRPEAKKLADVIKKKSSGSGANVPDASLPNPEAMRRALVDLMENHGKNYPRGEHFLSQLAPLAEAMEKLESRLEAEEIEPEVYLEKKSEIEKRLESLRREALLANPLLDFEELVVLKRSKSSPRLGLPNNWQSNSSLPKGGFDDAIVRMSMTDPTGALKTVHDPEESYFVGDVDLHWDAEKLLFSSVGTHNRWQVFEIGIDGEGLRQLTGEQPDVDSYDACYLPDDRIIFTSTACMAGVPCVYGSSHIATLFLMDAEGKNLRQLCFDQEHNWSPAVLNNGRVLYQRWEYSDTPHSNTRLLFHCNPDGTSQMAYYGSNSYWPNSTFYARPIPEHPTMVAGIVTGHHGTPRAGELVLFDPARGRHEADGVVQRIPGWGEEVEPVVADRLVDASWPKFLHPYPLSEKYFIVSCKPTPQSNWGIYLVDVFDNVLPLRIMDDHALMEPIPLKKASRPPVIPDKVDLERDDATVYLADIYNGDGLKDIPRGTVKELRIFTYHFSYQNMGGLLGIVGADGPWDIKQVLGTVPVKPDGSCLFQVPANTPFALQPLDENGRALQLMRSWMTAMPGEVLQCNGCHEPQNMAAVPKTTMAVNDRVAEIEPWYGPRRGFAYPREVQPIVDKYCVGCHDGSEKASEPDLRGDVYVKGYHSISPGRGTGRIDQDAHFSVGYFNLQRYVRRPGIESDYHMLEPMEFHAGTTELVQLLEKGHHGVELSEEGWDRLQTWIDLNCPYHGTWWEATKDPGEQRRRRIELAALYAGLAPHDPEEIRPTDIETGPPIIPEPEKKEVAIPHIDRWPLPPEEAVALQRSLGETEREIEIAEGLSLKLAAIPAGKFVMGSASGYSDQRPLQVAVVEKPFWMATTEITNDQFQAFDPNHDSRVESKHSYQFGIHGYPLNLPEQPVCRVTWNQARAFCRWLSNKTGLKVTLPSEAQWEWAARAGSDRPFWFGDLETDFSPFANFADARLTGFVTNPYTVDSELANPPIFDDWIPKEDRFDDGSVLSVAPGQYAANPWGLHDIHGNVAEWTRTTYRPHPVPTTEPFGDADPANRKVVRGGSWYDRPKRGTSATRFAYKPYQKVFNVGFRIIVEDE